MPESTNNQPQLSLIDELKSQLGDIKDKMKKGQLSDDVFKTLSMGAKLLQNKLDGLLQKRGIYTQSDVNDAYATMQEVQRRHLELESNKSKYRLYIYLGAGLLLGVGIYLYLKRR